jgi:hypothetical protein
MKPIKTVSETVDAFAALTDDELVARVKHLATCERRASVGLIRSLVEFDTRRLYLREGCSSLFAYCTHMLHLIGRIGIQPYRDRTSSAAISASTRRS